jgi:hypothetical protein
MSCDALEREDVTIRYMSVNPLSLNMATSNKGPPLVLGGMRVRMQNRIEHTMVIEEIPMVRNAHLYPALLMRYRFNDAKVAPPRPDPATVIPEARPRFLSNHCTGIATEVKIAIPAPNPYNKPF